MPFSDFSAFDPAVTTPTADPLPPDFSFTGSLMDRAALRGTLLGDIDQRAQRILAGQRRDDLPLDATRYRLSQMEGEQAVTAARRRASVAEADAHYQRLAGGEDLLHRAATEAPQLAARLAAETDPAAIESHAADFLSRYAPVAGAPEFGARFDRLAAPISHLVATKPAALRQRYAAAARGLSPILDPDDPAALSRIESSPLFGVAQRDPQFARSLSALRRKSWPAADAAAVPSSVGTPPVADEGNTAAPGLPDGAAPAMAAGRDPAPSTIPSALARRAESPGPKAAQEEKRAPAATYGHIGTNNGFADAARTLVPRLDQRIVVPPHDKALAQLSNAVYGRRIPTGWEQVDAAGLKALGLDSAAFYDPYSGFAAALYRDTATGGYAAAFRGTEDRMDVGADGQQGYGLPTKQYEQAITLARQLHRNIRGKLEFTGHSLGGGLAAAAALATDRKAITYNAAGLHPNTLRYNKIPASKLDQAEQLITAYAVRGEPLNSFQDNNFFRPIPALRAVNLAPPAIGFRVALDPKMDGVISQHEMSRVLAALDQSP